MSFISLCALLAPALIHASPVLLPAPTVHLVARDPQTPGENGSTISTTPTSTAASTATSGLVTLTPLTSTATNTTDGSGSSSSFPSIFSGIPYQVLEWVAVVIIVAVIISLLAARYLYIKRFYPPTFRAFFVPIKGININWLGIHIKGPPPRNAPLVMVRQSRRRRDRTANGPDIGEGGRRGQGGAFVDENGESHELPAYAIDTDLPTYDVITPDVFNSTTEHGDRNETETQEERPGQQPMSVQDYEEQTRRAAAAAVPLAVPSRAATSETAARQRISRVAPPAWEEGNTESHAEDACDSERRSTTALSSSSTLQKDDVETDADSLQKGDDAQTSIEQVQEMAERRHASEQS